MTVRWLFTYVWLACSLFKATEPGILNLDLQYFFLNFGDRSDLSLLFACAKFPIASRFLRAIFFHGFTGPQLLDAIYCLELATRSSSYYFFRNCLLVRIRSRCKRTLVLDGIPLQKNSSFAQCYNFIIFSAVKLELYRMCFSLFLHHDLASALLWSPILFISPLILPLQSITCASESERPFLNTVLLSVGCLKLSMLISIGQISNSRKWNVAQWKNEPIAPIWTANLVPLSMKVSKIPSKGFIVHTMTFKKHML